MAEFRLLGAGSALRRQRERRGVSGDSTASMRDGSATGNRLRNAGTVDWNPHGVGLHVLLALHRGDRRLIA